jgi:hypothetical protein
MNIFCCSSETENSWVHLVYRILTSEDRLPEEAEMVLEQIFKSTKLPTCVSVTFYLQLYELV